MRLEIDRIPAYTLTSVEFFARYYKAETPVILTGLDTHPNINSIVWARAHQPDASRRPGHIAIPMPDKGAEIVVPSLVRDIFAQTDISCKSKPLKLWMQPQGHCSHLHYDGNSLHGMNWQVTGRKHWLLISPNTPPRLMPFTQVAMTHPGFQPDPTNYDFYDFETAPGEMLFLPRYWIHQVTSLGPINTNLNWVWTPTYPNQKVTVGKRESAVIKIRSMIGRLDQYIPNRVHIQNYGDGGMALLNIYTAGQSRWSLLGALAKELSSLIILPFFNRAVNAHMGDMQRNNFNIEPADLGTKSQSVK